jgi:hypothetical protein
MRSPNHSSTRVPPATPNAWSPDFLRRLDDRDEPPTAHEAEVAGIAVILPVPGRGFCLYLPGERPELGHLPVACFTERWRALLAAAVLPGTGRDPAYRLRTEEDAGGFALVAGLDREGKPKTAGHLRLFDEPWAAALAVADALLRSPEGLALLLEAAGKVALARAGTILEARVPPAAE